MCRFGFPVKKNKIQCQFTYKIKYKGKVKFNLILYYLTTCNIIPLGTIKISISKFYPFKLLKIILILNFTVLNVIFISG